jgi:hypothetical protein
MKYVEMEVQTPILQLFTLESDYLAIKLLYKNKNLIVNCKYLLIYCRVKSNAMDKRLNNSDF